MRRPRAIESGGPISPSWPDRSVFLKRSVGWSRVAQPPSRAFAGQMVPRMRNDLAACRDRGRDRRLAHGALRPTEYRGAAIDGARRGHLRRGDLPRRSPYPGRSLRNGQGVRRDSSADRLTRAHGGPQSAATSIAVARHRPRTAPTVPTAATRLPVTAIRPPTQTLRFRLALQTPSSDRSGSPAPAAATSPAAAGASGAVPAVRLEAVTKQFGDVFAVAGDRPRRP